MESLLTKIVASYRLQVASNRSDFRLNCLACNLKLETCNLHSDQSFY